MNQESKATSIKELGSRIKNGTWLVMFAAEWSSPCMRQAEILEAVEDSLREMGLKTAQLSSENFPELAERWSILAYPTILIIRNGSVKCRLIGVQSAESIWKAADRINKKQN
ncbi:Thioredoxin-1 [Sedimentisphaera cyanobacteriorum]|uniref:Thioredoxin-1 n=1 Tax=Sedimentisphaera cyanobacteriorum TaxID=1940790 RepID=A0A1Q2HSM6_9BACT|nr:thioredoxin family protein [Sedimentisphaera cyanobacteriorum]AQQ10233.1 Thioredoxin-1 [Sedimentisphaera cyanobacteriorum]